tara:strand:+ start:106 stop:564 length:459 start_codon:yes stop_codon:yes gene_type:complete
MSDKIIGNDKSLWPDEILVNLEKPFVDDRGSIQPLVDQMMKSAVMIESKKGSLRANHYHKTDWHYCYVISGSIEYFHRPTGSKKDPEKIIVKNGQMIFTPPMVDHAMKFPSDTLFLTLSRNPRDQKTYEEDVVRIDMVNDKDSISWKPDSSL